MKFIKNYQIGLFVFIAGVLYATQASTFTEHTIHDQHPRGYTSEMPMTSDLQEELSGKILAKLRHILPCKISNISGVTFRRDAYGFIYRGYPADFIFYMIKASVETERGLDWLHMEVIKEPFPKDSYDVIAVNNGVHPEAPLPLRVVRHKIHPCPS